MTLTLRSTKGSALTYTELDENFLHLQSSFGLPPWSITSNTAALTFSYSNTAVATMTSNGHITVNSVLGDAFVSQDDIRAPYFANSASISTGTSTYVPIMKLRMNGAANTRTISIGGLHNTDNTVEAIIHAIDAGNGNNRIWRFQTTGDFVSPGNVTAYSDIRLKDDVQTIENALDKVSRMRGVTFNMNGKRSAGVIAQELQEVMPELVNDGEYLSVAYGNLVGVLIEAIKELKAEIDELKRGE